MKDFVKMTSAVAVGSLVACGVLVAVTLNERVLTAYTKKVADVSMKMMEKQFLADVKEEE